MSIQLQGFGGVVPEVDSTFRALRVSPRPPEILGSYRTANITGSVAATLAAASTLFSMRWTDASKLFILDYVAVEGLVVGTITTGVVFNLALEIARAFSASDTGGTAVTLTGNNQKMRTSHATSVVGDMRIASTATLTPGTRTIDANPVGLVRGFTGTVANTPIFGNVAAGAAASGGAGPSAADVEAGMLYRRTADGMYPIVLAQNEGFLIRNPLAGPASGTFNVHVKMAWFEASAY
jgi:hypothetical protein